VGAPLVLLSRKLAKILNYHIFDRCFLGSTRARHGLAAAQPIGGAPPVATQL
jgi:hypothetical protein